MIEVLDPRTDPPPPYWADLRQRAGLRADWAWRVLEVQSWSDRCPHLITVLHDGGEPVGVVNAGWLGLPGRYSRFLRVGARPRVGALHVRGPGSSAVPGWWMADGVGALAGYQRAMRAELGFGCVATVLRQASPEELSALGSRVVLSRITEPIWGIDTAGLSDVDGWLGRLDKKRRSNLRVIGRKLADRVALTVTAGEPVEQAAEVTELLRGNNAKYKGIMHNPVPQLTGYIETLTAQPDTVTFRYTDPDTGRLVGVGILLDHPTTPVWRTWAMVPVDDGGVRDLYFLHITRLVEWVTAHGRPALLLGKGKGRLKSSVGATERAQYAALLR
ncbi:GNAT family N-acetyltransferase [Actinokineospora soli]|uniref:GNAT family N-acetyltransferase n=1 Tax=Actinokineospora soli TaxID=1048753 RepID=A0ABW2TWE3_9PSEU